MSDDLIERLRHRADTMNGASPVGAGDGNTYACGYYGLVDRRLDREVLDALAAKDTALSEMRAELERVKAALEKIASNDSDGFHMYTPQAMQSIAARALAPSIQDETDLGARG